MYPSTRVPNRPVCPADKGNGNTPSPLRPRRFPLSAPTWGGGRRWPRSRRRGGARGLRRRRGGKRGGGRRESRGGSRRRGGRGRRWQCGRRRDSRACGRRPGGRRALRCARRGGLRRRSHLRLRSGNRGARGRRGTERGRGRGRHRRGGYRGRNGDPGGTWQRCGHRPDRDRGGRRERAGQRKKEAAGRRGRRGRRARTNPVATDDALAEHFGSGIGGDPIEKPASSGDYCQDNGPGCDEDDRSRDETADHSPVSEGETTLRRSRLGETLRDLLGQILRALVRSTTWLGQLGSPFFLPPPGLKLRLRKTDVNDHPQWSVRPTPGQMGQSHR